MNRRSFLLSSATALLSASTFLSPPNSAMAVEVGGDGAAPPEAFSFDILTNRMRDLSTKKYQEPKTTLPDAIAKLTYDEHRAIRFRPDHAVWKGQSPFELQAFHLGWLFKEPVQIFQVEDGKASTLVFTGKDFEYRAPLDPTRFEDLTMPGVAGFRLHFPLNKPDVMDELVSFLGASYFRALGRGNLYGLSARGLAVNTATDGGEEFPRFTDFYIVKPVANAEEITIYAALDSPSLAGAVEFRITPGRDTQMDVTMRLFTRSDIQRLGIAPMTSMFLFGENNHSAFDDYRGEVHDSDGLKIIHQNGDEVWRSLNNPKTLASSFFTEQNPRGFGLFQRDHTFEHYQDAEAGYQRRPSLLVEPTSDWGKGAITLVEIPSQLEVNDNIVAFWVPDAEVKAGQALEYKYRLTWGSIDEPTQSMARVQSVRTGTGGVSGVENTEGQRKFVIDFKGEALRNISDVSGVEAQVSVSNGDIVHSTVSHIDLSDVWRVVVDLKPQGGKPVELNVYLTKNDERLSETWLYQWRVGDEEPR